MKPTMLCCECGESFSYTGRKALAGRRCKFCAQENWVRWLKNQGELTRDGEPDGHTPAMSKEVRAQHRLTLRAEIEKLKGMREAFPDRAKAYREKNKDDWRSAPYDIKLDLRD